MLDFQELFLLAQSSESGCNSVRQITSTLSPPIEIYYASYENSIILQRTHELVKMPLRFLKIRFVPKSSDQVQQLGEAQFKTYPLGGSTKLNVAFLNKSHVICAVEEGQSLVWMTFECIDYLKNVFSAQFSTGLFFSEANKDFLMNLTAIEVPTDSMSMGKGTVSHQDMRNLLGVSWKTLTLDCTPVDGFVYEKPIPAGRLTLKYSQWFSRSNLLDLNASRVSLGRSTLKSEDLNAFIHQWFQGGHEKLEHLMVFGSLGNSKKKIPFPFDLDMEKVLEGVKTLPGIGKNGHECTLYLSCNTPIPYDKGLDIRRESDGMRATILYSKTKYDRNYFVFAVWNTSMIEESRKKWRNEFLNGADLDSEATRQMLSDAWSQYSAESAMFDNDGEVSYERMRIVLESRTDVLDSVFYPKDGFYYLKPLSIHTLKLKNANWFNGQNLMELDSARIHLGSSTLTSEDLNLFIHQWLNGSSTKLEYLCIAKADVDLALVTDGMLTMPGSSKVGLKTSLKDRCKFEDGLDVQRTSDGLMATVVFDVSWRGKFFAFVVWHPEGSSQNADVEEVVKESEGVLEVMGDLEDAEDMDYDYEDFYDSDIE